MKKVTNIFFFTKSRIIDELKKKSIINHHNIYKNDYEIYFTEKDEIIRDYPLIIQIKDQKNDKNIPFSIEKYLIYSPSKIISSDLLYTDLIFSTQTFLNQ